METAEVRLYRQDGPSPDPDTDTYLGNDTTFGGAGEWSINTSGWSEGRYTIYAVGYDLAGNVSSFVTREIKVLPDPMKVSGLVDWYLGELDTVQIGSFSS